MGIQRHTRLIHQPDRKHRLNNRLNWVYLRTAMSAEALLKSEVAVSSRVKNVVNDIMSQNDTERDDIVMTGDE